LSVYLNFADESSTNSKFKFKIQKVIFYTGSQFEYVVEFCTIGITIRQRVEANESLFVNLFSPH
jgi:hypothetical protein